MVKVLTAGEEEPPSRLDPSIFREIMSGAASSLTRHTRRGAVASFYVHISFSGEKRTWTSAYRTVSSYLKCASITSGGSTDAATSRWICREPEEAAGEMASFWTTWIAPGLSICQMPNDRAAYAGCFLLDQGSGPYGSTVGLN